MKLRGCERLLLRLGIVKWLNTVLAKVAHVKVRLRGRQVRIIARRGVRDDLCAACVEVAQVEREALKLVGS